MKRKKSSNNVKNNTEKRTQKIQRKPQSNEAFLFQLKQALTWVPVDVIHLIYDYFKMSWNPETIKCSSTLNASATDTKGVSLFTLPISHHLLYIFDDDRNLTTHIEVFDITKKEKTRSKILSDISEEVCLVLPNQIIFYYFDDTNPEDQNFFLLYDVTNFELLHKIQADKNKVSFTIWKEKYLVFTAEMDEEKNQEIKIIDLKENKIMKTISTTLNCINSLFALSNGNLVLEVSVEVDDGKMKTELQIWNLERETCLITLKYLEQGEMILLVELSNNQLAAMAARYSLGNIHQIWDVQHPKLLYQWKSIKDSIGWELIKMTDSFLITSIDSSLEIRDIETGTHVKTLHLGGKVYITAITAVGDDQLAISFNNGSIQIWEGR